MDSEKLQERNLSKLNKNQPADELVELKFEKKKK